jgi:nitrite transporter NirC
MIFWCLFAFITTGFEHSIANMTLLTEALLNPCGVAVTMGGYMHNLLWVTFGNMIGGILFIAVPYAVSAKE